MKSSLFPSLSCERALPNQMRKAPRTPGTNRPNMIAMLPHKLPSLAQRRGESACARKQDPQTPKPKGLKTEQAGRKRKNQEVLLSNARQRRKQTATAENAVAKNIGAVENCFDSASTDNITADPYNWDFAKQIHMSHDLRAVRSSAEAFYCNRCCYYNDGGQLRALRKPCLGFIAPERKHLANLLQHGQVPRLGTKLGCGWDE